MANLVFPFLDPEETRPRSGAELPDDTLELAPPVRLERRTITVDGGRRVGIAVAGRGVPFVVVHGFGVESLLYAQPLARLAALGFRVVAVDAAGHGASDGPRGLPSLDAYVECLEEALDELGVRRCVLAGHSMGGRLVAEVAARRPDLAVAVVLVDAIVGEAWERVVRVLRRVPPAMAGYGAALALDTVGSVPVLHDVRQTIKLGSRVGRSVTLHLTRPWRSLLPGRAILLAPSSLPILDGLHDAAVAVVVIHGERDLLVPLAAGRDAAARTGGELVVVQGGSHSWLLRCPETLPAIVGELLGSFLGEACASALRDVGVHPPAGLDEIERACTRPGVLGELFGAEHDDVVLPTLRTHPRFSWVVEPQSRSTTSGA